MLRTLFAFKYDTLSIIINDFGTLWESILFKYLERFSTNYMNILLMTVEWWAAVKLRSAREIAGKVMYFLCI